MFWFLGPPGPVGPPGEDGDKGDFFIIKQILLNLSIVIRILHYSITGEIGAPGEKGFKGSKGEMVNNIL